MLLFIVVHIVLTTYNVTGMVLGAWYDSEKNKDPYPHE